MAQAKLDNYLKTYRKRAGLSQDELAYLLGCADGAKVSRYERRARQPSLETILAYRSFFRADTSDLFAGLYEKVEKKTKRRAQTLARKLAKEENPDPRTAQKLATLEQIMAPVASGIET